MALDLGKPTKPVSCFFYSQFTPNQQSFLVAIVKLFRIAYNEDMEKGILKQNGVHLEDHEYETVKLFLDLGYDIELIPPSKIKGLQMPDLMLQGIPWEMKSPKGSGKNTIKHTLQNAGHQSSNIIVDLRRCKLPEPIAQRDLNYYFKISKRIRRMKVVINEEKIVDYSK